MSACFYDMGGGMIGFADLHMFIAAPTIPVPFTFHFAAMLFRNPVRMGEIDTVTSEGKQMAKQGFKVFLIPQVPITKEPAGGLEAGMLVILLLTSKSTAYLGRSTVTHGGTPLACCVASMVGVNGNCGWGAGLVINPNSVVTTPSAGDFAGAVVGRALDLIVGYYLGKALPQNWFIKPVLKFIIELTTKKPIVGRAIKSIKKQVQETVDALL